MHVYEKGSTMKRVPKRRDSFGEDSRSEDSEQEEHIKVRLKIS